LIAHGSQKNPASAAAARLQKDQFLKLSKFSSVDVAFLEQEPTISQSLEKLVGKVENIICLGLFAAEGPHATEDVPAEIDDWQHRNQKAQGPNLKVFYKGAVGVRSEVVKLIQDSVSRRASRVHK
jgi:sirohydrochlorin ferrochelatase